MMTSSNGNIFRVTGPLCGEFTGPGEFPTQRPVTRSFDVFFDLRLNKRLSKQPWGWWFETPSWSSWRHCNAKLFSCFHLVKRIFSHNRSPWLPDKQFRLIDMALHSKQMRPLQCYRNQPVIDIKDPTGSHSFGGYGSRGWINVCWCNLTITGEFI